MDKKSCFYPDLKRPNENFKKVVGHFEFWSPKWSSGPSNHHFLQQAYSQGPKKISTKDTTLIFFPVKAEMLNFSNLEKGGQKGGQRMLFF